MISLDKLAYTSTIRMKNPNEKLCFSILFLFLCIFSNDIVMSSLVFLTMGIMTVFVAKISLRVYLKLLLLPLFFTLFGVLGVVFAQWSSSLSFQENNMLIYLSLLLKALASTSCLYFLILTTPMVDIIYSLQCIRLPKLFLEIMILMYRYIFVLLEFMTIIYISQDSRLGYSSYKKSFYSMGKLVSALFLSSYQKSMECYSSMESRAYQGEIKVLDLHYRKNSKNYVYMILMAILYFAIVCLVKE